MNEPLTRTDVVKAIVAAVLITPVLYGVLVFWLGVAGS